MTIAHAASTGDAHGATPRRLGASAPHSHDMNDDGSSEEATPGADPAPLTVRAAGRTDQGRARETNEDSFAAVSELGLFMVADGMGGHAHGEVASRMAVDVVRATLEAAESDRLPRGSAGATGDASRLSAAVQRANGCIYEASRRAPRLRGMGTTFAGVLAEPGRVVIAHVGDSRVYRLREGELERLTEDHSLLQDFLRIGMLQDDDVASHRLSHILTRALGIDAEVDIETRVEPVRAGDVLLLCSDGLTGVVGDPAIASILSAEGDPDDAALALVERANEAGGPDNVTCVVLRWQETEAPDSEP